MLSADKDIEPLYRELARRPATSGGRLVLFMSAHPGEGVSGVATEFALFAAERSRRAVWLIDLDLQKNGAFNTFAVGALSSRYGGVSKPYPATLGGEPFFALEADNASLKEGQPGAFTVHRVGETRLMVTHFDTEQVKQGQALTVRSRPRYWDALRRACDWTVVDAPSLEASSAGLVVASQMDQVVIVAAADSTRAEDIAALADAVEEHGGRVAGVVLNRVRADARFLDRIIR
ncbi:sugar kinase [bacterium]|nr:sugar kinase [bacterium]